MPDQLDLKSTFEACVDQCADSMYRVAFRLTGNDTLARELVQNAYLEAWKNLSSLKDQKRMRAWMFAILRNQYSKLMRVESKALATSEVIGELASRPERDKSQQDEIQFAIERLDEKFKLPLLLVAVDQLSIEEISETLEIPKGTVLSRLHRGREKLREILSRHG